MKVKSPNVKSKNVKSRRFPKGKQPKTKKVSKPVIAKPDKRNSTAWEKVKLTGNLISDDGGTGLEGLLGLEVLESYGGVAITKAKHDRVKVSKLKCEEFCRYLYLLILLLLTERNKEIYRRNRRKGRGRRR